MVGGNPCPTMYHRNYIQELDVKSPHKIVPLPLALTILTSLAILACCGALALRDFERVHGSELAAKAQLEAKDEAFRAAARRTPTRTVLSANQR
jgi:hypothetical protein